MNENMLGGYISLPLLLESNWQLLTCRASLGPGFMLNLPTHFRTLCSWREGCLGLGAAETLFLLSAEENCLDVKDRPWPDSICGGGRIWLGILFSIQRIWDLRDEGRDEERACCFSISLPECRLVQQLRVKPGKQAWLLPWWILSAGSTWTTL